MAVATLCVVGAGTVGLEGLLYARERLGADAELCLIAPDREFRYRPMSGDDLLRPSAERSLSIADLVARIGVTWVADRAAAVHQDERSVLTRDGDMIGFDNLLLAVGSRPQRALAQGDVWERGGDPSFLDQRIAELEAGSVRSIAVVVPRGARWPIPAYELALVLAWAAGARIAGNSGPAAQVTLITAEDRPLGALGTQATDTVTAELTAAGVHVVCGVEAADGPATAGFDRLISLPTVDGPRLGGVAGDASGFIEVDDTLKVCGSDRIWAAGGCLAAALEHTALGARQADFVIDTIAAGGVGADGRASAEPPRAPQLTGVLLTGQRDRWRAENPPHTQEPSTRCLWWPPGRAVGKMLAREISAVDPTVHGTLPGRPGGVVISAPVQLGCPSVSAPTTAGEVSAETRAARLRDIENRQLMAVERCEREADAELATLNLRLRAMAEDQEHVIHELRQHGYLLAHHPPVTRPAGVRAEMR